MRPLPSAALLLAPVLIGCATANIAPQYRSRAYARPGAPAGKVFVSAPAGDVPIEYHGVGATQSARATQPLNDFLRETMTAELRAMGYEQAASEQDAKGVLSVAFTKARVAVNPWNGKFTADVALRAQLKDAQGRAAWAGEFVGTGHDKTWAPGVPGDVPQNAFNQALGAALDQFAPSFGGNAAVAALLGGAAAPASAGDVARAAAPAAEAVDAARLARPPRREEPAAVALSRSADEPAPDAAASVALAEGPQRPTLSKHESVHLTLAQAEKELLP